jgi:hypothetical protein
MQPIQSDLNSFGQFNPSPMQIDDQASHNPTHSGLSTPPTPQPKRPRLDYESRAVKDACEFLARNINADADNATISRALFFVPVAVCMALREDTKLAEELANEDEFLQNVKREGEEKFIDLLRDMARRGSWHDLFGNGTFHCLLI